MTFPSIYDYIYFMNVGLIYKEFGNGLRDARKSAGLTQQALADKVHLSRTSITNIEKGRQHVPLHMVFVLADALGVHASRLFPDKELISRSNSLDEKLSRMTTLQDDGLHWLQRVISSGMAKEAGDE